MKTTQSIKRIFISHSYKDKELAREIARRLREAGLEPLLVIDAPLGPNLFATLRDTLLEADAAIILLTPSSLKSDLTMLEFGVAQGFNKQVVPVVAGIEPDSIPLPLQSYHAVPFDRLDDAIQQLMQSNSAAPKKKRRKPRRSD